jgi:S-DNA-T family DNA segregation ATPase FtsK/SpoIIIE
MELEDYDPTLDLSNYRLPSIELLEEHKSGDTTVSEEELISNKNRIVQTLGNYKIQIDKIKATIGPTVTLYEIVPAPGIRISKIKNLEDDIALSLSALGIRIIAPIPGRGTIGIEVPNRRPEIVSMRSIIGSKKFRESKFELAIGLGKTISNETYVVELTKMPHLLIAGATGQGKSVGLNAIIASLLYKKHPAQLKFVMIDPKKVELTLYNHIEKHFLAKLPDSEEPIINDTQEVIKTLNSLTIEMDDRYNLLKSGKVRIIKEYNEKFIARKLNPKEGHRYLPYIVVIVDEFADLIMTAGREIEMPLARLAQLARAVGIHLIIATQRPSTNIITGSIKANFPVRIAFKLTSMMDSRTILDSPGANQLVGRGDMLISVGSDMVRLQCAFIDISEIERITDHISSQQSYPEAYLLPEYVDDSRTDLNGFDQNERDDLFEKAARLVVEFQQGSTSLIQRKFSIGYNRAGRIIDQLESAGIVGSYEGSKARQVLIQDIISLERFLDNDVESL